MHERRDDLRCRVLRRGGRAGRARGVDAGALQPALDLVGTLGRLRGEGGALAADASDDDHDDDDGDGHDGEQDDGRRQHTRHVPVEQPDDRHRHDRDDERADHRADDRVGLGQQPDKPDDQQKHPDEQPGAPAEVP